ncbi:MAG: CHRD domain-containing protein [Candidatus Deferrimicrobiaceae bacterium]
MRKTVLVPLMILAVSAFVVTGMSRAGMHGKMDDVALNVNLSAVPDVKTAATGEATFTMAKDGSSIHYKLQIDKIENVTMSHIHAVGEGGKRGAVITWLYPSTGGPPSLKEGNFSGSLAEGDITPEKFAGDWKGKTVKDLFMGIAHGKAGVAVHTKQNPGTELWGVYKGAKHAGKEHMEKEHGGKSGY